MSNVLFLGVPSHGHINPTIGLVAELVKRGERVTYFAALPFKERIKGAGATYRSYSADLDIFKAAKGERTVENSPLLRVLLSAKDVVDDVLEQIRDHEPSFLAGIRRIGESFRDAGGYPKAVDDIFQLKQDRGIED